MPELPTPKAVRWEMGWYNGWSPDERRATLPVQRDAIRSGAITKPSICSICGTDRDVWLHDERYDRPLEAYAVCRACHRLLHGRFDNPRPWLDLVRRFARHGEWFELLSLDPACQKRPFYETYPEGLPPSKVVKRPDGEAIEAERARAKSFRL